MPGTGSQSSISVMAQPHAAEVGESSLIANAFSREFRFLVAACVWPHSEARAERLSRALQTDLDWNEVLRLTERHRVFGLVSDAFDHVPSDAVPELVRRSITEKATLLARENLLLASESVRIARLMEIAGIPVAFLKGVPLAIMIYGGLSLRHSRDIDLLVSEEVAVPASQVLRSAGYQGVSKRRITADDEVQRWFRDNRDMEYVHENSGIRVELHVRMFENPLLNQGFGSECWQPVSVGGANLFSLKHQELFLYLCLHGAMHGWFRLKWLADIGALLSQAAESNSQQLLQSAEELNIALPVLHAVELSSCFLETPRLGGRYASSWRERLLTHIALQELFCKSAPEGLNFRTSRVRLCPYLFRSDWRYLWLQVRCDFTHEADRQLLPLPDALSFLYPILRPFLWVIRHLLKHCGISLRGTHRS